MAKGIEYTYVLLLLVNVSDLEPNVLLRKGSWRGVYNVLEALGARWSAPYHGKRDFVAYVERLAILLLLFVNDAEAEVYLVSLVEIGLDVHDVAKCLFGMVERAVPVIKNADAVPKTGFLLLVQFFDRQARRKSQQTFGLGR